MVPVVLVVVAVLEVPGPEIRILQEISSPEPAGNVREASGTTRTTRTPEGVLVVLVVLEGTKPPSG